MSTWLDRAHAFIRTLDIPSDADLKTCRRIFRERGSAFHGGTYWGRKKWGVATRAELTRRGLIERPKMVMPDLGPDIIFPFREIAA